VGRFKKALLRLGIFERQPSSIEGSGMTDYGSELALMKERRRQFADQFAYDDEPETVRRLGETHMAILALEAVMAEPVEVPVGPRVEFGEDGWPK
jgi:hypothetical protein